MKRFMALAGASLSLATTAATGQAPAAPADDFCARLARGAGIAVSTAPDGRTQWTSSGLNVGKRLFGGTVMTTFMLVPDDSTTAEEGKRMADMCASVGKSQQCDLAGPLVFKLTWKGQQSQTPLARGEHATVTLTGTKVSCRSEPSH